MHFTTLVFVLVAALAVISPSFSSPIPMQVDSAGVKRGCNYWACRTAEVPPGTSALATAPGNTTSTTPAHQSGVQGLVTALINALQTFQSQNGLSDTSTGSNTPSGSTTTTNNASDSTTTPSDPYAADPTATNNATSAQDATDEDC